LQAYLKTLGELDPAGGEGPDFREGSYTGIADALAHADFEGPGADEPYVARPNPPDISREKAEKTLRIAIARVQDPKFLPQDRTWTPAVYMRLAERFVELGFHDDATEAYGLVVSKFPLAAEAAEAQVGIGDSAWALWELVPSDAPAKRALDARVLRSALLLPTYTGETAWTKANRGAPERVERVRRTVAQRLRRVADYQLRRAAEPMKAAQDTANKRATEERWSSASASYRAAGLCIQALLRVDPSRADAGELQTRLREARSEYVRIQGLLHRPVEPEP
jgi:hypothetical protein